MRYIGNKENVIPRMYEILIHKGIAGRSLFDFFSGTTSVSKFYKRLGYTVSSSDFMYFSYCLQKAYIENNSTPTFERLLPLPIVSPLKSCASPLDRVIAYLNELEPEEGFIYNNYTPEGTYRERRFFQSRKTRADHTDCQNDRKAQRRKRL